MSDEPVVLVDVSLSDIEEVDGDELDKKKLDALENGYDSFEDQLNSVQYPIALDRESKPYGIINGRHRIYLAREKGYSSVPAVFA
jgi:hypothetical protein